MAAIADRYGEDEVDVTLFSSVLPSALGSTLFGVIAIRVDPDVLATFRKEARQRATELAVTFATV